MAGQWCLKNGLLNEEEAARVIKNSRIKTVRKGNSMKLRAVEFANNSQH